MSAIFNDTTYSFAITGMKKGMTARASMSNGRQVEVRDTTLFIRTDFKRKPGQGYDTVEAKLKLTVTDKKDHIIPLERTYMVLVSRKPIPLAPVILWANGNTPIAQMAYGIYYDNLRIMRYHHNGTNTTSSTLGPLQSPLPDSTERKFGKYNHLGFSYVDSTTNGTTRAYRAMDLLISDHGLERSYYMPSSTVESEMRKVLRKHRHKTEYTFILHKQYIKGDRSKKDRVDTLTYKPPVRTGK